MTNVTSKPLPLQVGPLMTTTDLILTKSCPENLLGIKTLKELGAVIVCSPTDVRLFLRDFKGHYTSRELDERLKDLPHTLWATDSTTVGCMEITPHKVTLKEGAQLPRIRQYKIPPQAEQALMLIIQDLIQSGVIKETTSNICNSPVLPVHKKVEPGTPPVYRLVVDLRELNKCVVPQHPVVPDISTLLTAIDAEATHFSVIDLKNAFFSIPIHPDSQYLFGFSLQGRSFQFTRAPQGFTESPSVYSQALKRQLDTVQMPTDTAILQYVDDILITARSDAACAEASLLVLEFLAANGHKVSPGKLQFCLQQVAYLGHLLSKEGRQLTQERIQLIQQIPQPTTQKQVRAFVGLTSYCRQWIPQFALISKPLVQLTTLEAGATPQLPWTDEHTQAFQSLKKAMCQAPVLATPNYTKDFTLFVTENSGTALSVLTQLQADKHKPCGYFSSTLDPVAQALPACLKSVAATAQAIRQSDSIVLGHHLIVQVPHAVELLLNRTQTQHLTIARLTGYEMTLFQPHIEIRRCNILNPATLLPLTSPTEEIHDCIDIIDLVTKPRPDLQDTPLAKAEMTLFVDGSCMRLPTGELAAAYAVTNGTDTLEAHKIEILSAQAAELIALTRACHLAKGKSVNIYTDSQYAFGVVHNFGTLWKERGFLTSHGFRIQHATLITALLEASQLPEKIAVLKCKAHTKGTDEISKGNDSADSAAKLAANTELSIPHRQYTIRDPFSDIQDVQSHATPQELLEWKEKGGVLTDQGWMTPERAVWFLPDAMVQVMVNTIHGPAHLGEKAMLDSIQNIWHNKHLRAAAKQKVKTCMICNQFNPGKGTKVEQGGFQPPDHPFEVLQMDYIQMERCRGHKYVLVVVCALTRWTEAYPVPDYTATTTAKQLVREFFPRYGLPRVIYSDNGQPFSSELMKQVSLLLGYTWKFHCVRHPHAAGLVERHNQTLKTKLAKICTDKGVDWMVALPVALFYMRMVAHSRTGLSPYEVVFGRPPNMWGTPRPKRITDVDSTMLTDYLASLMSALQSCRSQVAATFPDKTNPEEHAIRPGDWVLVRNFDRTSPLQPRWKKPRLVLLTTRTAVKVEGRKGWLHASHCRKHFGQKDTVADGPANPTDIVTEQSLLPLELTPQQDYKSKLRSAIRTLAN